MKITELNSKEIDILLHYHSEYLSLAKQAINNLIKMNSVLFSIFSIAMAFVVQQGFTKSGLFIGIIMILIGLYGFFVTTKYLNTYSKQYKRADFCGELISQKIKEINISNIKTIGRDNYKFINKLSSLFMYRSIYIAILALGITSIIKSIM